MELPRTYTDTEAPWLSSDSVRWEPMKPSAPVTRTRRPFHEKPFTGEEVIIGAVY